MATLGHSGSGPQYVPGGAQGGGSCHAVLRRHACNLPRPCDRVPLAGAFARKSPHAEGRIFGGYPVSPLHGQLSTLCAAQLLCNSANAASTPSPPSRRHLAGGPSPSAVSLPPHPSCWCTRADWRPPETAVRRSSGAEYDTGGFVSAEAPFRLLRTEGALPRDARSVPWPRSANLAAC